MSPIDLSVVVPVYNERENLGPLVEELISVLRPLRRSFEIVLVNDGSRDGSWRAIEEVRRGRGWVRAFDLARNFGQHSALLVVNPCHPDFYAQQRWLHCFSRTPGLHRT